VRLEVRQPFLDHPGDLAIVCGDVPVGDDRDLGAVRQVEVEDAVVGQIAERSLSVDTLDRVKDLFANEIGVQIAAFGQLPGDLLEAAVDIGTARRVNRSFRIHGELLCGASCQSRRVYAPRV